MSRISAIAPICGLALIAGLSGCGSDGSGSGGSGSGGSGSGNGLAVGGPSPQGNFTILLESTLNRPDGTKCQDPFSAGLPADPGGQPSHTSAGVRMVNGASGAVVSCTVQENGATFSVQASVGAGPTKLELDFPEVTTEGASMGQVSIDAFGLSLSSNLDEFGSDYNQSCSLTPIQIQRGAVWATFNCPGIGAAPANYCAVSNRGRDRGVVVLENCGF